MKIIEIKISDNIDKVLKGLMDVYGLKEAERVVEIVFYCHGWLLQDIQNFQDNARKSTSMLAEKIEKMKKGK